MWSTIPERYCCAEILSASATARARENNETNSSLRPISSIEILRIENLCRLVGFDERQTATLVKGKPLEYAGELYSEEHGRKFTTEKAGFQVVKDPTDGTRLVLAIDRKPIAEWFKEQFDKLRQNIRRPIQPQRKSRGMKI